MSNNPAIFYLPDLGEGLPDAEIHEWHVAVGQEVEVDQLLVSMETAKAVVDVPSPRKGKISQLFGQAGDTIDTGSPLIAFEEDQAVAPPPATTCQTGATVAGAIQIGNEIIKTAARGEQLESHSDQLGRPQILPVLRLIANELNLDLNQFKGTGPQGQITLKDFCQQLKISMGTKGESLVSLPLNPDFTPLKGVRKAMVQSMRDAHSQVVNVTLSDKADLHAWPAGQDFTVRLVRAICKACEAEPILNAQFDGTVPGIKHQSTVNLGIAVDTPEGLFVPVIKHAETQSPESLRSIINRFKTQAKDRSLPTEDLKNPTITLSNFGTFAGYHATPVVVPPMVAIIGAGRGREEAVPVQGQLEIHRILPLSLSFDHRAATGGEASRFLKALIDDLEQAL